MGWFRRSRQIQGEVGGVKKISHAGIDPSTIKRLALLVAHPEKGSRTLLYQK